MCIFQPSSPVIILLPLKEACPALQYFRQTTILAVGVWNVGKTLAEEKSSPRKKARWKEVLRESCGRIRVQEDKQGAESLQTLHPVSWLWNNACESPSDVHKSEPMCGRVPGCHQSVTNRSTCAVRGGAGVFLLPPGHPQVSTEPCWTGSPGGKVAWAGC